MHMIMDSSFLIVSCFQGELHSGPSFNWTSLVSMYLLSKAIKIEHSDKNIASTKCLYEMHLSLILGNLMPLYPLGEIIRQHYEILT